MRIHFAHDKDQYLYYDVFQKNILYLKMWK